jgi:hypothetical protein
MSPLLSVISIISKVVINKVIISIVIVLLEPTPMKHHSGSPLEGRLLN